MNKLKILGFCPAHYSGDYFKEALLSIRDHVDMMVISYSNLPSQGYSNSKPCPDSREYILQTSQDVLGDKLIWDEARDYCSEGEHRNVKYRYSQGYSHIVSIDSDEIMVGIPEAIQYAENNGERFYGCSNFQNFFRGFSQVCRDGFRPIRIEKLSAENQLQNLDCELTVLHFSAAQRREVMEYKLQNFGHASEVRPNYLREVFYKWTPDNGTKWLHSVSLQIWEDAVPYNKNTMPDYLKKHKYFNLNIIP